MEFEARQGFVVVPLCCRMEGRLRSISRASVLAGNPSSRVPFISSSELRHGVVRPQPGGLNQLVGLADVRGP
jgi:hypothetical protein